MMTVQKGKLKFNQDQLKVLLFFLEKSITKVQAKKHLTRPSTCEKSRPVSLAASSNELEEGLPEKLIARGKAAREAYNQRLQEENNFQNKEGTTPRPPGPSPVSCPVSFPGFLCHLHSLVSPSHCSESPSRWQLSTCLPSFNTWSGAGFSSPS